MIPVSTQDQQQSWYRQQVSMILIKLDYKEKASQNIGITPGTFKLDPTMIFRNTFIILGEYDLLKVLINNLLKVLCPE
jgi:hypothetical protein